MSLGLDRVEWQSGFLEVLVRAIADRFRFLIERNSIQIHVILFCSGSNSFWRHQVLRSPQSGTEFWILARLHLTRVSVLEDKIHY